MQASHGQGLGQLGTVRATPALNLRVLADDMPFAAIEITGDRLTLRFKAQPGPALFVCADAVISNKAVPSHENNFWAVNSVEWGANTNRPAGAGRLGGARSP